MKLLNSIFFLLTLLLTTHATAQQRVKVACVGNSITYGLTIPDRESQCYPAQLQQLLGDGYDVANFGKSGATLLEKGHKPYIKQDEFRQALDFAGDIVVIHLGVNDTDPRNWPNFKDYFIADYLKLINAFRIANPDCRILIARLTPILHTHNRFESGTRDWREEIQTAIATVAQVADVQLIDFEAPLASFPSMFTDACHPNAEGAKQLAKNVYSAITGNYGGLKMPITYSNHMVLQRNCNLPIHGTADAGAKITVTIANQKHTAITDSDGQWSVTLLPLVAGGPYTLTVTDGTRTLRYEDVLAGEVWLCTGQSNMEFTLNMSTTASADIPQSANDQIRLFDMKARWRTNAEKWDVSTLDSLNNLQYYAPAQWETADTKNTARFSAVAYYFGKMLQDSLKVPVGLICNAIGGSPTEAWIDRYTLNHKFPAILKNWLENDFIQDWVRGRAKLNIANSNNKQQRHPYEPCYLFESGIQSLAKFPIKGVIWYQGESNAHNIEAHEQLFPLLVSSFRNNWNNDNMPFYYVQLSSLNRPSWCDFRNSQRLMMQNIANVGMAVSSDYGDSLDVHPRNKKPIGERLARWALNRTYGKTNIVPSGPLFRSAEFRDGAVYVNFDYADGLRTSDGKAIRTFEVAEIDGLYEPAIAEIIDGSLKVYSPTVKNPRYIRYGWQPFTRANLVNADGLPASTFRAEAPARFAEIDNITVMQGFPKNDKKLAKGVSACFSGITDGKLLIAGGCNFPDTPAKDGGKKIYYSDIYASELPTDSVFSWRKIGKLPQPTAYGVSFTTSDRLICAGGMNSDSALTAVYCIRIVNKKAQIESLPSLPCTLDNMSGCLSGNTLYLVGGNRNGKASNCLYSLNLERLSEGWIELPEFPGNPRTQPVCAAQQCTNGENGIFIWGGFAGATKEREATLSVDGYVYMPSAKEWQPVPAPTDESGETISLGGGVAVAYGDSLIICTGGVNKDIFLQALRKPVPDYMSKPIEWYRFNDLVLIYNTRQQKWQTLTRTSHTARAGASLVNVGNNTLYNINGELKPGIRTPEITKLTLK